MGTESTGEEFERHSRACFAAARQMLGTVADAEDVVQETWLRWSGGDRSHVVDVRAYLVRTATRLALNRLRALRAQRETYVGPWLPEPLVTTPDAEAPVLLADSASTALLVMLEALSPLERAVFVLREVFDHPYRDIARTVHRSPGTVRQVAWRARSHVHANHPRHRVDSATHWRVTERFLAACRGGDVAELLRVLAPDVTLRTDGGQVRAARNPVRGADRVAKFLAGIQWRGTFTGDSHRFALINGEPGVLLHRDGAVRHTIVVTLGAAGIDRIFVTADPEKLRAAARIEEGHHGRTHRPGHQHTGDLPGDGGIGTADSGVGRPGAARTGQDPRIADQRLRVLHRHAHPRGAGGR